MYFLVVGLLSAPYQECYRHIKWAPGAHVVKYFSMVQGFDLNDKLNVGFNINSGAHIRRLLGVSLLE